jgi:hypothetical protein
MREKGVLGGVQRTGKGGHQWVYYPAMGEAGFKQFIAAQLFESLMKSFPEETRHAVKMLGSLVASGTVRAP